MERRSNEDGGTEFEALAAELGIDVGEEASDVEEAAVLDRAAYLVLYRDQSVGNAVGDWAKKHGGGWSPENVERAYDYLYANRERFEGLDEDKWFVTAYGLLMELSMLDKVEERLRHAA